MSFAIDLSQPNIFSFILYIIGLAFLCLFTMNKWKMRSRLSIWLKSYLIYPDRMRIYILRKYPNGYKITSMLFARRGDSTFKLDDNQYNIDEEKSIIDLFGRPILYYESGNATPLTLYEKGVINAKMFKNKMEAKNYHALFGGEREKIFMVMIVAIVIAFVGYIAFSTYMQQQETSKWIDTIKNMTKR